MVPDASGAPGSSADLGGSPARDRRPRVARRAVRQLDLMSCFGCRFVYAHLHVWRDGTYAHYCIECLFDCDYPNNILRWIRENAHKTSDALALARRQLVYRSVMYASELFFDALPAASQLDFQKLHSELYRLSALSDPFRLGRSGTSKPRCRKRRSSTISFGIWMHSPARYRITPFPRRLCSGSPTVSTTVSRRIRSSSSCCCCRAAPTSCGASFSSARCCGTRSRAAQLSCSESTGIASGSSQIASGSPFSRGSRSSIIYVS